MSMQGTSGEDRIELNKDESRIVRLRARRLLFSLIRPVRRRLIVSFILVILSQAFRVVGPALSAYGIDSALPKAIRRAGATSFT